MSVLVFLYRELYNKIIQSRIIESCSFEDILIRCSDLTKKTPPEFQMFAITLLHYSIMFLNGTETVVYDQFKLIIHDFIQISFERYAKENNINIFIPQIDIISCIMARIFYEYLLYLKRKKEHKINIDFD